MQAHTNKLNSESDSKAQTILKECYCDRIYKAAKNPDKNAAKIAIKKLLRKVSIDVLHPTTKDTAVSKLAADGDVTSVDFLRKEFGASWIWIVYGYARGGYVVEVNKAFALAQTSVRRRFLLEYMVSGYVLAGNMEEIRKLFPLVEKTHRVGISDKIIFNLALRGEVNEVNTFLGADINSIPPLICWSAASGYVMGGYDEEALKIWELASTPKNKFVVCLKMAEAYSRIGSAAKAKEIFVLADRIFAESKASTEAESEALAEAHAHIEHNCKAVNIPVSRRQLLWESMIIGFAKGGHHKEIDRILRLNEIKPARRSFILTAIRYYACNGYVAKVKEPISVIKNTFPPGADFLIGALNWAALGYGISNNVIEAQKILEFASDKNIKSLIIHQIIRGLVYSGYVKTASDFLLKYSPHLSKEDFEKCMETIVFADLFEFLNENRALQTLSAFHPTHQKDIVKAAEQAIEKFGYLKDSKELNLDRLIPKASKLNILMSTTDLNFPQSMSWIQPEMQVWLLQGRQLFENGTISARLFLNIVEYIWPHTEKDIIDLASQLESMVGRHRECFFSSKFSSNPSREQNVFASLKNENHNKPLEVKSMRK